MRLKINDLSFSEPKYTNPMDYVAYLDGELQTHCIEADERKRYIKRYKIDKNGLIVLDDNLNPIVETLYGKVELKKVDELLSK